ncbi:hypothetical protein [Metabacillus fastidiosus]
MTNRFVIILTLIGLLVWSYLIFYLELFSPAAWVFQLLNSSSLFDKEQL